MKKRTDSPFQMILVILVLINAWVLREGFLVSSKLYFALFGTIPLAFFTAFRIWKSHRKSNLYQI
jgi:hypothetical protein